MFSSPSCPLFASDYFPLRCVETGVVQSESRKFFFFIFPSEAPNRNETSNVSVFELKASPVNFFPDTPLPYFAKCIRGMMPMTRRGIDAYFTRIFRLLSIVDFADRSVRGCTEGSFTSGHSPTAPLSTLPHNSEKLHVNAYM